MTAPRSRAQTNTEPDRYGTPMGGGHTQGGHDFTLQAVMDLKQSVGELKEAGRNNQATLTAIEQRIGKIGDRVDESLGKLESRLEGRLKGLEDQAQQVKITIHSTKAVLYVIGAIALAVLGGLGWLGKEVWDVTKPLILEKLRDNGNQVQAAPAPPAPPPAAAPANRRP
ncbi:hypothetical protein EJP67_02310 [Variovorax guangxiensis]|uniref:DUF1515 domain-containing protein n=1 Tax=Variovorax guangxiensis TaxID=1775474 RepID=A0A433MDH7_9BURK|nr:hypothetical protein [Variovorax guangxiensis]RUR65887.1 hypothetical protein EJP67_02310 [Variovorax guangxiensis]